MDFPEGGIACGEFSKRWGLPTKKRDNKKYIYEQPETYLLTSYVCIMATNTNLIYTDETWVNAYHNNEYIWIDSDGTGGLKGAN